MNASKKIDESRKSIRKDVLEGELEALVQTMQPNAGLVSTVASMFRDIWNHRLEGFEAKWSEQKRALSGLGAKINALTER